MVERKFKEVVQDSNYWTAEKENDSIQGEITNIVSNEYGNQYEIKLDDESKVLTPSHKVLQNRMKDMKVGDYVKIQYTHEELPTVKGNNPTKFYKVFRSEWFDNKGIKIKMMNIKGTKTLGIAEVFISSALFFSPNVLFIFIKANLYIFIMYNYVLTLILISTIANLKYATSRQKIYKEKEDIP